MHRLYHFWLNAHAAGLGHDAVIEITIAILGVMVAVLALIAFIMSVGIAVVSLFGYQSIKTEAVNSAEKVALDTATKIAQETTRDFRDQMQASELSQSQAEELDAPPVAAKQKQKRTKATNDQGLRKEGSS